jgi:hypothetical protein
MKKQLCGVMIKKQGMPKARPCLREKGHRGCRHTPDLSGLKNVFGYAEILGRGKDFILHKTNHRSTSWLVLTKFGTQRRVRASELFNGVSRGTCAKHGIDKETFFEAHSLNQHYNHIFNAKTSRHSAYKNMAFYDAWNPKKGGLRVVGALWIRKNLGPRPSEHHQLHVLKTKKHPFGFFGPGGIAWRRRMDRHDQDLLDLVAEWSNKKWKDFIKQENQRRLIR